MSATPRAELRRDKHRSSLAPPTTKRASDNVSKLAETARRLHRFHGMWLILCVFVGVAAAVTANYISGKRGVGLAFDAVLGITGAYVTGFVFNRLAGAEGEVVSVASLAVSAVGAAAILGISWILVGRDGPVF